MRRTVETFTGDGARAPGVSQDDGDVLSTADGAGHARGDAKSHPTRSKIAR
jgi:hypothetical protein